MRKMVNIYLILNILGNKLNNEDCVLRVVFFISLLLIQMGHTVNIILLVNSVYENVEYFFLSLED